MSLLWHLGKGSQGPVDLGFEPTEAERRPYDIHQSGKWYTNENIDQMLMERHFNKKVRRSSHKNHMKGPRKRTEEDDVRLAQSFEKLIPVSYTHLRRESNRCTPRWCPGR